MTTTKVQRTSDPADTYGSLLFLAVLSLLVGAAVGLVSSVFRLSLEQAVRE